MAAILLCLRRANQNMSCCTVPILINSGLIVTTRSICTTSNHSCKGLLPPQPTASSYSYLLDKTKENRMLPHRQQFALALKDYMSLEKYRRGHVKFIREGLHRIDEFGLQKDLITYNRLIDIFPKGRFNNKTFFDSLWPKPHPQIDLALDILQKMEDNGIRPDYTTYSLLCEIFGRVSFPVQKCTRIAVWFDKFEDVDPYRVKAEDMPTDPLLLCEMALRRIAGQDCQLAHMKVPGGSDASSFVTAASSRRQVKLLESLCFKDAVLHVEGPHLFWLQRQPLLYYSLRYLSTNRAELPTEVDDDQDGSVLGVCLCRPPTQESLALWIESLHNEYPSVKDATVVYDVTVFKETYHELEVEMLTDCTPTLQFDFVLEEK